MMEECSGGRVRHPATHREVVKLEHWQRGKLTQRGEVCKDHFTKRDDWEVDGWVVMSIRRSKL